MGFRFRFNATTLAWLSGLLLANTGSAQQLDQLRSAVEEIRLHNDQPSPTPTPNPLLVRGDSEGRKRQLFSTGNASPTGLGTTTFSITQAPDKTCGFLSGAAGVPITCGNGKPCAWETQYVGAIYCGWESTDRPKLRCIERSIATNSASCDNVCQLNVYYLLCTNATEPYCGTFAFPNGVKSYRCATETQLSASSVSFRYNNEPVCLRPFTTTILGDDITSTINTCATSTSRITTSGSSTSTPAPPSTSEPISPGSSSVSPTSTNSAVPSGGDSSNTGAIVGGVVGGVAVLGLIGLGAFFLIRRSRRNSANGNNNIQQVQQPPSGPYPSDPKFYGGQGPPGSPGQQPAMGEGFYATGPSPTTTYDPTFKSQYGSVSVDPNMPPPTAVSQTFSQHPGQHHPSLSTATSQDFGSINRASYASTGAPPVYQPPLTQQQQPLVNQPMSAIHEIGSGEDHHRGTLHEVQ